MTVWLPEHDAPATEAAVIVAWALVGVAVLLIAGNAVFVAAETALVTVDRNVVESRVRAGDLRFTRVQATLRRLSTYLSGAQLGITVTSLAIGLVAEPSVAALLRGPLGAIGLSAEATEIVAIALALLLATAVRWCSGTGAEEHRSVPSGRNGGAGGRPAVGVHQGDASAGRLAERRREPALASHRGGAGRGVAVRPPPEELASVMRRAGAQGALGGETAASMERSLASGRRWRSM